MMPVSDARLSIDVESIRADFPILSARIHDHVALVYLDNAASTQRPSQVAVESLWNIDYDCGFSRSEKSHNVGLWDYY